MAWEQNYHATGVARKPRHLRLHHGPLSCLQGKVGHISYPMQYHIRRTRKISGVCRNVPLQLRKLLCMFGEISLATTLTVQSGRRRPKVHPRNPDLTAETLQRLSSISQKTKESLDKIIGPLLAVPPFSLGYPGKSAQSAYSWH